MENGNVTGMAERLTFEGDFCEIARCRENRWGKYCPDGACSQRKVWERLKQYEDSDAVSVVRCKDCKYWQKFNDDMRRDGMCEALLNFHGAERNMTNEDFFCSYGERKTNGN